MLKRHLYIRYFLILFCGSAFSQTIQWTSKIIEVSSEISSKQSSAGQVTGPPSAFPQGGKNYSAWQPAIKSSKEYIKIGLKKSVKPKTVFIAENYKPGSVSKIYLIDKSGKEHLVKKLKAAPVEIPSRILAVKLDDHAIETTSIKVVFDVSDFEEMPQIDAIGVSDDTDMYEPSINLIKVKMADSQPVNLGTAVNTVNKEVAPVISPDGKILYFTRDAPENIGGKNQDIWQSFIDSNGRFKDAINLGPPINNERNNYASALTPDGQTMLVGNIYSDDGQSNGNGLSISKKVNDKWSYPEKINIRNYNNRGKYTSAYLANDAKTLLIAITRDDTHGGEDIYVCFEDKNGNWTQPLNLGPKINTAADEYTPFIASDLSTLYFTSDGLPGFGAGDIYMSKRLDNTWKNWSEPVNLGPSFNTPLSDFYFTIPASGEFAYYVSATNAIGATDIFRIKLPAELQPSPVVMIKGKVLNAKTLAPVAGQVHYETLPQGEDKGIATAETYSGKYKIVLPPGSLYGFRASHPGYMSVNENLDLQKIDRYVEIEKDLYLVPIESGQKVIINNLFFESNKSSLTEASYPELNRLAETLIQNQDVYIEIGGHTDDVGSDEDNRKLSQERASKVLNYLFTKGVQFFRMQAVGYGETQPLYPNTTDENRYKNRRVEFKIIKK